MEVHHIHSYALYGLLILYMIYLFPAVGLPPGDWSVHLYKNRKETVQREKQYKSTEYTNRKQKDIKRIYKKRKQCNWKLTKRNSLTNMETARKL